MSEWVCFLKNNRISEYESLYSRVISYEIYDMLYITSWFCLERQPGDRREGHQHFTARV